MCSCRTTQGTAASTIFNFFKFPKPPGACFQKLVKVSSQLDERCVFSNDISRVVGTGKGDGHADNEFSLLSKVERAEFHQDQEIRQLRISYSS